MDEIQRQGDASQPIFDRQTLLDRVDGDDELVDIVLGVFLDDAPQALQAIERALGERDRTELRSQAHALKGAAANISAEALRSAAGHLEELAQTGSDADAVAGVTEIRAALADLTPVLSDALHTGGVRAC